MHVRPNCSTECVYPTPCAVSVQWLKPSGPRELTAWGAGLVPAQPIDAPLPPAFQTANSIKEEIILHLIPMLSADKPTT